MVRWLEATYSIPHPVTGGILAIIAGLVLLGGIKRIGQVASKLVPTMAFLYVATGLIFILLNMQLVPEAIVLIVDSAFNGHAAVGGFAGAC